MDNRPVIILAYANSTESPLGYLATEIEEIQRQLGKRDYQLKILPIYTATIPKLRQALAECKDRTVAFMYSGHAGDLQIETAGDALSAIGLANELSQCPILKLVMINGCSSAGHVSHLLNKQIPVVIATEAPINDKAATIFSATFWKEMSEDNTVANAFQLALNNAQNYRTTPILKLTGPSDEVSRSLDTGKSDNDTPWILKTTNSDDDEWSITDAIREFQHAPEFKTNKLLTDTLYREFSKTDETINDLSDFSAARGEIYSKFPQFITKYIHDLCAPPAPRQGSFVQVDDSFSEPDVKRLKKMSDFFKVLKELLKSITLAEVRELLIREPEVELPESLAILCDLTKRSPFSGMTTSVDGINLLKKTDTTKVMVKDLLNLDQQVLLGTEQVFFDIKVRIEKAEKLGAPDYEKMHPKQAGQQCELAEARLSELLTQLIFLKDYTFVTIKNMIVYKDRTRLVPSYGFALSTYKWTDYRQLDPLDTKEKITDQTAPDNHCVLLIRKTGEVLQELNTLRYLNLSPFLIDNNVLYDKAQIPNISFCDDLLPDQIIYRTFYVPSNSEYVIHKQSDSETTRRFYHNLRAQFDHFGTLLGMKIAG